MELSTKSKGEQLQLQPRNSKSITAEQNGTRASNYGAKTFDESDGSDPGKDSLREQQQPSKEKLVGEMGTIGNILKGNLGTGILALPQAFFFAGLYLGLVMVPLIGMLCIYCMHLLVRSSRELCGRVSVFSLSIDETAGTAFSTGPKGVRFLAPVLAGATKFFIITVQIGFLCVYYGFIADSIRQVLECSTDTAKEQARFVYCLALLPFLLVMNSMKHLKNLAYVSMVANFTLTLGLCIILFYSVRDRGPGNMGSPVTEAPLIGTAETLPLFFGIAIYAFEGISLVMPIEHKMKQPSTFLPWNGVLNTSMTLVLILYVAVGYYGCLHYGTTVKGVITLSLPSNDKLALCAKVLVAFSILLTYPLQAYVVVEAFLKYLEKRGYTQHLIAKEYAVRYGIVTLTCVVAILVQRIGLFISLVGSSLGSFLALILPPLVHLVTFWDDHPSKPRAVFKALLISFVGVLGMLTGTYGSMKAITENIPKAGNHSRVDCSPLPGDEL